MSVGEGRRAVVVNELEGSIGDHEVGVAFSALCDIGRMRDMNRLTKDTYEGYCVGDLSISFP